MGMYSVNTSSETFDVPVMEGFEGTELELQDLMVESYQDQLAMFETGLMGDMRAAMGKIQGLDEEAIESIQEGVLSDLWGKIKSFFQKLWARIKSIFNAFMARFNSVFMKSNKEFVNKYKAEVMKKNLTDMKVTFRQPKSIDNIKELDKGDLMDIDKTVSGGEKAIEDAIEKFDADDFICEVLKGSVGNVNISDPKDYEKEAIDELFEEEEEHDNIDVSKHIAWLMNSNEALKGAKKAETEANKKMSQLLKQIEKHQNEVIKAMPSKKGEEDKEHKFSGVENSGEITVKGSDLAAHQKGIRLVQMKASAFSTAVSKYAAIPIKAIKMHDAISRKIVAKAVAYRKKSEDAYLEAMTEAVLHEWDSMDQQLVTEAKKAKKKDKKDDKKLGAEVENECDK